MSKLARRFHAWYTKFKPLNSAVVSTGDPELGAVVQVEGIDGAAPPAKKTRYILTLNDSSAAPCAAPAVPSPAAPAAADEGGICPWRGRCSQRGLCSLHQ